MKKFLFVLLSLASITLTLGAFLIFGGVLAAKNLTQENLEKVVPEKFTSGTWRYKTTVVIETPEGDKTGSAVREVKVQLVPGLTSSGVTSKIKVSGEAVVVHLGKRGTVFALMRGASGSVDYRYSVVFDAFPFKEGGLTAAGVRYYNDMWSSEKINLDVNDYPQLVRFRDPSDPKTVENLIELQVCDGHKGWPNKFCIANDHFEEAFGKGVKLKEVNIEMTKEDVTQNINQLLPWLPDYYNKMLDGQRFHTIKATNRVANGLASGAFSTTIKMQK